MKILTLRLLFISFFASYFIIISLTLYYTLKYTYPEIILSIEQSNKELEVIAYLSLVFTAISSFAYLAAFSLFPNTCRSPFLHSLFNNNKAINKKARIKK